MQANRCEDKRVSVSQVLSELPPTRGVGFAGPQPHSLSQPQYLLPCVTESRTDQSQKGPLSYRATWCYLDCFIQLQGHTNSNIQSHAITLLKAGHTVTKTHSHKLTYYHTAPQYYIHKQT